MGKNRARWGQWSPWHWHDQYGTYYRVREDDKGHYDYEYDENPGTPRTAAPGAEGYGVNALAEQLDHTTLVEQEYTTDPGPERKRDRKDDRTGHPKKDGKRDRKGKGKAAAKNDPPEAYEEVGGTMNEPETNDTDQYGYGQTYATSYSSGQYYPAGASRDAYTEVDDGGADGTLQAAAGAYAPLDETEEYEGQAAYYPPVHQPQPNEAAGQLLDSKYTVRRSNEFVPGKILKVYWSEPRGGKKTTTISQGQEVYQLGELVYSGFRRLIVIATDYGHSVCVPILTYESRGCSKPGVKPHKHGIIYDERKKPRMLHGEPELGFRPVRARMSEDIETLARESRVNYSKSLTIEHNTPILFVGDVHPDDYRIVWKAYDKCWKDMTQPRDRGRHR